MVITYQSDNYFRIQSGEITVLIDPTNARAFKGANVILNTVKPAYMDQKESADSGAFWIEHQGEYEREGIRIEGWSTGYEEETEKTCYLFNVEGISIAVAGHPKKELSTEIVEKLQGADILILPSGSTPYIDAGSAAKLTRQIEPGIVIPSLIKNEPKKFFDELGVTPQKEDKLVIKKKDISAGAMEMHYLKA